MLQGKVKPGHPTGTYHRGGLTFTINEPVSLEGVPENVLKILASDPWLMIFDGEAAAQAPGAKPAMTEAQAFDLLDDLVKATKRNAELEAIISEHVSGFADLQEMLREAKDRINELSSKLQEKDEEIAALREDAGKKRK